MARPTNGHIKLWRSIQNHWVARDGIAFATWLTLLCWACFEDTVANLPRQRVKLRRGQIATSSRELADQLGVDRKTVERRLKEFANDNMIVLQPTNCGTIITILNYDHYQDNPKAVSPTSDQQKGPKDTQREGQQRGHIRRREEGKKKRTKGYANSLRPQKKVSVSALARATIATAARIARAEHEQGSAPNESAARLEMGVTAFDALKLVSPSWSSFAKRYLAEAVKGYAAPFERDLVDALRAQLQVKAATASETHTIEPQSTKGET